MNACGSQPLQWCQLDISFRYYREAPKAIREKKRTKRRKDADAADTTRADDPSEGEIEHVLEIEEISD